MARQLGRQPVVLDEHSTAAGVLEDEAHLGGSRVDTPRHVDSAERGSRQVRHQPLVAILRHQADAIAVFDPAGRQPSREAPNVAGNLAEGHGLDHLAVPARQEDAIAVAFCAAQHDLSQR